MLRREDDLDIVMFHRNLLLNNEIPDLDELIDSICVHEMMLQKNVPYRDWLVYKSCAFDLFGPYFSYNDGQFLSNSSLEAIRFRLLSAFHRNGYMYTLDNLEYIFNPGKVKGINPYTLQLFARPELDVVTECVAIDVVGNTYKNKLYLGTLVDENTGICSSDDLFIEMIYGEIHRGFDLYGSCDLIDLVRIRDFTNHLNCMIDHLTLSYNSTGYFRINRLNVIQHMLAYNGDVIIDMDDCLNIMSDGKLCTNYVSNTHNLTYRQLLHSIY